MSQLRDPIHGFSAYFLANVSTSEKKKQSLLHYAPSTFVVTNKIQVFLCMTPFCHSQSLFCILFGWMCLSLPRPPRNHPTSDAHEEGEVFLFFFFLFFFFCHTAHNFFLPHSKLSSCCRVRSWRNRSIIMTQCGTEWIVHTFIHHPVHTTNINATELNKEQINVRSRMIPFRSLKRARLADRFFCRHSFENFAGLLNCNTSLQTTAGRSKHQQFVGCPGTEWTIVHSVKDSFGDAYSRREHDWHSANIKFPNVNESCVDTKADSLVQRSGWSVLMSGNKAIINSATLLYWAKIEVFTLIYFIVTRKPMSAGVGEISLEEAPPMHSHSVLALSSESQTFLMTTTWLFSHVTWRRTRN